MWPKVFNFAGRLQTWNSLGLVAFDLGRNAAALHAYREAIRLRPRFVHAHINLAIGKGIRRSPRLISHTKSWWQTWNDTHVF